MLCMELGQYHITLNEEHVMVPELDAVVEAGLFLLVLAVCMFSLRVHCCLCCVITVVLDAGSFCCQNILLCARVALLILTHNCLLHVFLCVCRVKNLDIVHIVFSYFAIYHNVVV